MRTNISLGLLDLVAAAGSARKRNTAALRCWRQLAALKTDIAAGLEDLDQERYQTYTDANVMQLAEEIGRSGRERLKNSRKSAKFA